MTNKKVLDRDSEYFMSSFGKTTGVGLSQLLDGEVSHGQF